MCGIVGFIDRLDRPDAPAGEVMLRMLDALACRGPDGSGAAVWRGDRGPGVGMRVHLGASDSAAGLIAELAESGWEFEVAIEADTAVVAFAVGSAPTSEDLSRLARNWEVLAVGERLDLVKHAGSPRSLNERYRFQDWRGPVAIGHTRMSTESRIDLTHSQPFWILPSFDLAFVHNGHITNYHKLRRFYEKKGYRFRSENDSEVIGVYFHERLIRGEDLVETAKASTRDLDGSFSYILAHNSGLIAARDRFGLKPLLIGGNDGCCAIATEEIAIRKAFADELEVFEPNARTLFVESTREPCGTLLTYHYE